MKLKRRVKEIIELTGKETPMASLIREFVSSEYLERNPEPN